MKETTDVMQTIKYHLFIKRRSIWWRIKEFFRDVLRVIALIFSMLFTLLGRYFYIGFALLVMHDNYKSGGITNKTICFIIILCTLQIMTTIALLEEDIVDRIKRKY